MKKNLSWIRSAATWETPAVKQWKTLESNTNIKPAITVAMDIDFGEFTDGCIFGTFENCAIPDYCIDFLWRQSHSGYLLTHQILFHYMTVQVIIIRPLRSFTSSFDLLIIYPIFL